MSAEDHLRDIGNQLAGSITPHSDAAELALIEFEAKMTPAMSLPGREGVSARMQFALVSAMQRAVGREFDGGIKGGDVALSLAEATASMLVSHLAGYMTELSSEERRFIVHGVIASVNQRTLEMIAELDNMSPNNVSGIRLDTPNDGGHA